MRNNTFQCIQSPVIFVFEKKLLKRNAELLNGNTECDTLQIIPLVEAIHTNVVRLYISGFIGLEVILL